MYPCVDGEPIGYIYTGPDPASLARKNGPHYYHHDTGCQVPMASPSWVPHWLTMVFRFSGIPTTVWVNEARENPSPGARDSSHPSSAWQDRVGDGKHVKFETGMVPPPNPLFHRLQMPKDIQRTMVAKSAYVEIVTSLDYVSLLYSKRKRGCKRRARGSYVGQVFRVVAGVCGGVGEAIGVVEGIGNRSVKGAGTSSFLAGVDKVTVEREVPQAAIHLRHDEVHVCIPRTDLARAEGRRSNDTPIVVNERRNYLQTTMEGSDRDEGDQGNEHGNYVSTSSDSVALDITGRPSSGVDVADTFVRELLSTFFRNQMLRMAEGAGRIGNNAAAVTMRARAQHPNADIYSFRLDPTQHIVMAATETRLARVDYIVRDSAPAAAWGAGSDHELLIATGEPLPKNEVLPIGPTTIITELDLGTDLAPAGAANVVDDVALGNAAPANLHAGNFQNRIQQNYRADDAGGLGGLGLESASSALQPAATAAADPGRTTSEVAGAPAFTAAASAKKVARPTLLQRGANLSTFVANAIARTPQQSDGVTRLPAGLSAQLVDRPSGAYMHEVSRQRRRSRPPPSDGSQPTLSAIPEVEMNVEAGDDAGASASAGAADVGGAAAAPADADITASAAAADANSTTAVAERAAAASSSSSSSSSSSASDNAENAGEETPDEVAHELANGNQDGEETLAHQRAAMTSLAARFSRERKTPFMTPIAEPPSQVALFVMFWAVFFLHYGTLLLFWKFLYDYIYYTTTPATDEQGDVDVAAAAYSDTMWIFLFLTLYYGRFVVRQLCTYLMTMLVLERGLRVERAVLRRRSSLHKELVMCGGEDEEKGVEYGTDGDETAAEGTALNLQVEDPFLTRGVDYQDLLPTGNSTTAFDIFVAAQERASGYHPAALDASHDQSSSGTPFSIGFRFLSGLRVIAAQEFTSYLLGAVFLLYWVYGVEHCDELIYWLAAPALLETGLPALTVIGAALFLFAWFWTAYVWIVLLDLPAGQRLSGILSVAMVADHANKKRIEQEVLEKIPVVLYKDIVQTFPVAVQRQVLAGIEAEQGSAAVGNSEAFRELQESVRAREQEQGLMQMKQDAAPEPEASSDLLGKCSICYCEFGLEDYVIQSPCFQYHIFHPECITDWWKQSRLCPLCRTDIPEKITGRPYKPQHRWRNFTIRNTAAIDGGGEEGNA
eukprot:g8238.t1